MRGLCFAAGCSIVLGVHALAQPPRAPAPATSARDAAPVDLTGYWVSPVMEDWRWRMVTPLKGDAASVPVNAAARAVIDAWDPAEDEAAGDECKAYGAPALLRVPGRLRIRWQDDDTLEIAADAGEQTRLLRFGPPPTDVAGGPLFRGDCSVVCPNCRTTLETRDAVSRPCGEANTASASARSPTCAKRPCGSV